MLENLLYIILAVIGLGILVFIHELGHYFMAKRVKMTIEVFSIGFGKPIFSWYRGDIKWQIAILPFGGYVKIKGMQKENNLEPYEIKGGFFASRPIDRIKVALMGPLVNVIFAFLLFCLVFSFGGRNRSFSEVTKKIGYVDPKSKLYNLNVRAGDEILKYNNKKYTSSYDLLYASVLNGKTTQISGNRINYFEHLRYPFDYTLDSYKSAELNKDFRTIGILAFCNYLIYNGQFINSDLKINDKDRLLWANGNILFSNKLLDEIINNPSAFLTIQRGNEIIQTQIPLVKISELAIDSGVKNELEDYRYDNNIKTNLADLYNIAYFFNDDLIVEKQLKAYDLVHFNKRSYHTKELKKNDKIIAINNQKVKNANELFKLLQTPKVLIITQKKLSLIEKDNYLSADKNFDENLKIDQLKELISKIGTDQKMQGDLYILDPIAPLSVKEIANKYPDNALSKTYFERKKEIEKNTDPIIKDQQLIEFKKFENKKFLGINLADISVKYNPNPFILFKDGFLEIYKTLISLITGYLSPKHLAGPVGIIQIVKKSFSLGFNEALFWMGLISLNLGVFNLFPLPVLDGGHILFSLYEMITRKPLKAKTMERLIIPFVVLLIIGIIFITYQDIIRIFTMFF
jgi:regulator of sigma E protease